MDRGGPLYPPHTSLAPQQARTKTTPTTRPLTHTHYGVPPEQALTVTQYNPPGHPSHPPPLGAAPHPGPPTERNKAAHQVSLNPVSDPANTHHAQDTHHPHPRDHPKHLTSTHHHHGVPTTHHKAQPRTPASTQTRHTQGSPHQQPQPLEHHPQRGHPLQPQTLPLPPRTPKTTNQDDPLSHPASSPTLTTINIQRRRQIRHHRLIHHTKNSPQHGMPVPRPSPPSLKPTMHSNNPPTKRPTIPPASNSHRSRLTRHTPINNRTKNTPITTPPATNTSKRRKPPPNNRKRTPHSRITPTSPSRIKNNPPHRSTQTRNTLNNNRNTHQQNLPRSQHPSPTGHGTNPNTTPPTNTTTTPKT